MRAFRFSDLIRADLVVDAVYESDRERARDIGSEPLSKLTGTGNQGGFRFAGPRAEPKLVVLYSTMDEPDWPDELDLETGLFTYFGDNRTPGFELHDPGSGRGGNGILRASFEWVHEGAEARARVPPFFVFSRGSQGRDAVFRGLAAPGALHLPASDDLVAVWKTSGGRRFQNYKATFTVLDVARVSREWIDELHAGTKLGPACPQVWRDWVATGKPTALITHKVTRVRTAAEQFGSDEHRQVAKCIFDHFSDDPVQFERFAADIVRMMDDRVVQIDVTRPSRDGGRDAVGLYRVGLDASHIVIDFAVEAKCYSQSNSVGVRALSRLISRLRHRQFGVLVTTSYLADQAYSELVEDGHPIVVLAGGDLAQLLRIKLGLGSVAQCAEWLKASYPIEK